MRWQVITLCVLLAGAEGVALGTDYTYNLNVRLVTPQHAWINLEDCGNDIDLKISWSLPTGVQEFLNNMQGDVFLATSSTCDSAAVEIGDTEDVDISAQAETGDYPVQGDTLTVSTIVDLDCQSGEEEDYYFCIKLKDTDELGNTYTWRGGAAIRWDVKAPGAPLLEPLVAGEENLKVSWEAPADEDLAGFYVYWRVEGSGSEWSRITKTGESSRAATVTGLSNDTTYEVQVSAYDRTENEGALSNLLTGTPLPVDDFYEYYRKHGGSEPGGFCFVATAAYGSSQDAMVQPLRSFRDQVLARSSWGRALIDGYYRYGPRWARAIRGSETHRALARWLLTPAVAFAELSNRIGFGELLVLLAALAIAVMLGRRWLGRLRRPAGRALPGLLAAVLTLGAWPAARAAEDVPSFELQVRLGPYYPDVDSEASLDAEPFKTVFGSSSGVLFELGLDYEIWHGFGTVTAGGSFGFVQYVGKGRTEDTGAKASDTTVLNLLPLRLSVGYHFDLLAERLSIPLVPYVSGGISYYIWWVLDGVGDVADWKDGNGKSYSARGGLFGTHLSVGLKLLLDILDQEAAQGLREEVGVMNTFLFAEFFTSQVNNFGSGEHMNLGDQTFMFGLMMEF